MFFKTKLRTINLLFTEVVGVVTVDMINDSLSKKIEEL
jgi:hypothetical protein